MTADIILNLVIFGVTLYLVTRLFRKDGKPAPDRVRTAFRFFTVQSNVLCALAALITAVCRLAGNLPRWAWMLKYIGTAAVSVTMVTVFVFLAPSIGKGWVDILLKGGDLFMHLLTPLMALVSFCFLEKQGMTFAQALAGLLPVALYGPLYLYKILFAGKTLGRFLRFQQGREMAGGLCRHGGGHLPHLHGDHGAAEPVKGRRNGFAGTV